MMQIKEARGEKALWLGIFNVFHSKLLRMQRVEPFGTELLKDFRGDHREVLKLLKINE